MKNTIVVFALTVITTALANEPLWTVAERISRRVCVIEGEVTSVTRVRKINEHADLMEATMEIKTIVKDHEALDSRRSITAFYELSPNGAGARCPSYADPKTGDNAIFYLGYDESLTGKPAFIIRMGSDIQRNQYENDLRGEFSGPIKAQQGPACKVSREDPQARLRPPSCRPMASREAIDANDNLPSEPRGPVNAYIRKIFEKTEFRDDFDKQWISTSWIEYSAEREDPNGGYLFRFQVKFDGDDNEFYFIASDRFGSARYDILPWAVYQRERAGSWRETGIEQPLQRGGISLHRSSRSIIQFSPDRFGKGGTYCVLRVTEDGSVEKRLYGGDEISAEVKQMIDESAPAMPEIEKIPLAAYLRAPHSTWRPISGHGMAAQSLDQEDAALLALGKDLEWSRAVELVKGLRDHPSGRLEPRQLEASSRPIRLSQPSEPAENAIVRDYLANIETRVNGRASREPKAEDKIFYLEGNLDEDPAVEVAVSSTLDEDGVQGNVFAIYKRLEDGFSRVGEITFHPRYFFIGYVDEINSCGIVSFNKNGTGGSLVATTIIDRSVQTTILRRFPPRAELPPDADELVQKYIGKTRADSQAEMIKVLDFGGPRSLVSPGEGATNL